MDGRVQAGGVGSGGVGARGRARRSGLRASGAFASLLVIAVAAASPVRAQSDPTIGGSMGLGVFSAPAPAPDVAPAAVPQAAPAAPVVSAPQPMQTAPRAAAPVIGGYPDSGEHLMRDPRWKSPQTSFVKPTIVAGLFVFRDRAAPDAQYIINARGSLGGGSVANFKVFDPNMQQRAMSEGELDEISVEILRTMDTSRMIKRVYGKGTRKVILFTSADCPICRTLEQSIEAVKKDIDVTFYLLLTPLQAGPQGWARTERVGCSQDPSKAWDQIMLRGVEPTGPLVPGCRFDRTEALAQYAVMPGGRGVPRLFLEDGRARNLAGASPEVLKRAFGSDWRAAGISRNIYEEPRRFDLANWGSPQEYTMAGNPNLQPSRAAAPGRQAAGGMGAPAQRPGQPAGSPMPSQNEIDATLRSVTNLLLRKAQGN